MPKIVHQGDQTILKMCNCGFLTSGDWRSAKFIMNLHKKKCNGKSNNIDDNIKCIESNVRQTQSILSIKTEYGKMTLQNKLDIRSMKDNLEMTKLK